MRRRTIDTFGGLCLVPLLAMAVVATDRSSTRDRIQPGDAHADAGQQPALMVHYLEVVSMSPNETCDVLSRLHGIEFGRPIAELGAARTASLPHGGLVGVRLPMHAEEKPVVRPYMLVDDIDGSVKSAAKAGATIMVPPMHIPGRGTIAIYTMGGTELGLWQLQPGQEVEHP